MTKIIDARRKFKSRLDAKQDVSQPIPALMGDGAGNIDVDTINQPGQVFIRVGDGDLGQAFNNRVPRADNLAIDVGYDPITDPDQRIFQVLNVRMSDYAGAGNTPYPNVGPHHELHEYGGGDDVYVSWRRLMGFRVGRPSAFTVTVDEGNIIRAGAWLAVLAQTLNLAASQAALLGAQARYVLIALDSAGVATATAGAIVAVGALDISDCPIPAAGEIPLAAVRLYGTQTSIGDVPTAPDIIDLRFPQAASTGTVFLSSLQPGTAQYQIITSGPNPFPATWSAFKVQGTANGITNLAVTATKTLTLTSADDYNLTAERTGFVIVRTATPNIVGDAPGAGNARGLAAVDFQLSRAAATQVASGAYSAVLGGSSNTASGLTFSIVIGGSQNTASGINAIVLGGNNCIAAGNYSLAVGRQALTGANAGVFIWADSTAAAFNGLIADEFAIRARGGFRHAYDDSNYWQATVSAAGAVTFNATGASAGFAFSDVVTIPAAGLIVTGMARGDILAGNATPAFGRLALGGITGSVVTRDANDVLWSAGALSFAGAFTLTIPATGTAALLEIANAFTAEQNITTTNNAYTFVSLATLNTATSNAGSYTAGVWKSTGVTTEIDLTHSTAGAVEHYGNNVTVRYRGSENSANAFGRDVNGYRASVFVYNTGTVGVVDGFALDMRNLGAGTVTAMAGVHVPAMTNSGGGAITTTYGVKIDALGVGSTRYAFWGNNASAANVYNLYMAGTAANYFGGNVTINAGDLIFTTAGSGVAYGSCYGNEIGWSQAAAAQNTWYNISDADMTDGHGGLNLVTHDGSGKLTVTNAGRYLINYSVTLEASVANDHIQTGIELNGTGTAINDAQQHWDSVANKEITMGSTAIVSLAASGYFEISVRTTDANSPTITVSHLNISAIMVGG